MRGAAQSSPAIEIDGERFDLARDGGGDDSARGPANRISISSAGSGTGADTAASSRYEDAARTSSTARSPMTWVCTFSTRGHVINAGYVGPFRKKDLVRSPIQAAEAELDAVRRSSPPSGRGSPK